MSDILKKNIDELLPHKEPFLFVDKILSITDESIVTSKIFKKDDDYFKGHFPGNPIVPGVLIIESMAQTAGLLVSNLSSPEGEKKETKDIFYLSKVIDMKFRAPIFPEDPVKIKAGEIKTFGDLSRIHVSAEVGSKIVAEGELILSKLKGE